MPPPPVDGVGNVIVPFEGNGFMLLLEVDGFEFGVLAFLWQLL